MKKALDSIRRRWFDRGVNNNKNMKKTILILTSVFAVTAKAEFVDFELDTLGTKANIFGTHASQGVLFEDTDVTAGSGTWLRIVNNTSMFHSIGNRALWSQSGDTSAIKMTFTPEDVTFLSFQFANDQIGGDVGRLRLFDGSSSLPFLTIYELTDANAATWETMSYFGGSGPSVKTAIFDLGTLIPNEQGPALTLGPFTPDQILPFTFLPGMVSENIDNIVFTPVPEVQTYASLFGVGLVAAEMLRRRRRTA